jgi:hypothetical protein
MRQENVILMVFLTGSERLMDVIDVVRQSDVRMSLHDFVEYYMEPVRTRTFNVISLEFSDSQSVPSVVYEHKLFNLTKII